MRVYTSPASSSKYTTIDHFFRRWMVLSSKGNIDRKSRRGVRLANIFQQLTFGDWLVLSLLGSNVQSSYFEQILLAVSHKLHTGLTFYINTFYYFLHQ